MKYLIKLAPIMILVSGCSTNPKLSQSIDELSQRFAGKKYSVEVVQGEEEQYLIKIFNSDVQKRRMNRQIAITEICPYSKVAEVLAEKDDHKLGTTKLVVWCRVK